MATSRKRSQYTLPENHKECDIVLKGGITSGIVYPRAICKLASRYRFRNIGGTSVGALCAALVAAAEFGRTRIDNRNKTGESFDKAHEVAGQLAETDSSGRTKMFKLFQPQKKVSRLYFLIASLLYGKEDWITKVRDALAVFKFYLAAGVLIGAASSIVLFFGESLVPFLAFSPLTFLQMILISTAISLIFGVGIFISRSLKYLAENNYFGFCTGFDGERDDDTPSLVQWMHNNIQEYSNKQSNRPLTFGELWSGYPNTSPNYSNPAGIKRSDRQIQLQFIATNISHGRPYTLPFEPDSFGTTVFYFKPIEMRQFFPDEVVSWLKEKSPDYVPNEDQEEQILRLPRAEDLPIIFAARLSLSYPILLSAVPLHAINHYKSPPELAKCWFSDGGICSNFPIHFFDQPFPKRPTFGIDLLDLDDSLVPEEPWMPAGDMDGVHPRWYEFSNVFDFLFSVLNAGLNWIDNLQMTAPGFRDRIVHIVIDPKKEGGLHLNLEEGLLTRLADRGEKAADELIKRFYRGDHDLNWDHHRFVRFRTTMMLFEKKFRAFKERLALLNKASQDELFSYDQADFKWVNCDHKSNAIEATQRLSDLIDEWEKLFGVGWKPPTFDTNAPEPRPKWQMTPRI